MKRDFKVISIVIFKVAICCLMGYMIYMLLAPIAYEQRGYVAYGGECILSISITVLTAWYLFYQLPKRKIKLGKCNIKSNLPPCQSNKFKVRDLYNKNQ